MIRKLLTMTCLWGSLSAAGQNLPDVSTYLGYSWGARFTSHEKIAGYFQLAEKAFPQTMKLLEYGKTYENRPLLLAFISSPENISKLEDLRQRHLAMSDLSNKSSVDSTLPVFIWLSYNVHGNEASSSEVSMKLLFDLLVGKNTSLLQRAVIIIDPCLNPDGRERYVSWYNRVSNAEPNADPASAEHDEPWPSGRGNHYYFDLNRDWVWQTQSESSMRIREYGRWLPQVHVDFHEQYPGNPYYFAPAAEPYHEAITPWQRYFQTVIGKNNAAVFDSHGWLYFTREYFDLFYPGYGDTYPMYNGSIGMTYEQAGHGIAGLAIQTGDDTLTLRQRAEHHYASSMSTIITACEHQADLNREFRKYFLQEPGKFKTYVIKAQHPHKMQSFFNLLEANGIAWDIAQADSKANGIDYFTNREGRVLVNKGDVLINAYQQKSSLLRVMFEPAAILSDSATYDITAWALPYAYGLQSYAVKERLVAGISIPKAQIKGNSQVKGYSSFELAFKYGCIVEYASNADGKLLASLLKAGVKIRVSEKDIRYQGKNFLKGSLIILKADNQNKISIIEQLLSAHDAQMNFVNSGFMDSGSDFGSDKVHVLRSPRVAVLSGTDATSTAVGGLWYFFEQELNYPVTMLHVSDPATINWNKYDVVIAPDGHFKWLSEKDPNGVVKQWVRQGGRLIALEGSCLSLEAGDWGLKLKKNEEKTEIKGEPYVHLKKYGSRERDAVVNNIPGAIFKIELDNTHPLAFGYDETYFSIKNNGYLLEFCKEGWNVGVIKQEQQTAGFVGSKVLEKIQDGTVIAAVPMGRGTVVAFTDYPIFRSFWENGKLLLTNAIFYSGL